MGEVVPPAGEVPFLTITDKQLSRCPSGDAIGVIKVFVGKKRQNTPPPPAQL
jgi:hypothetical protein